MCLWHRLVKDTSVTQEPDNRHSQLLYYLNDSTIQRSPKVAMSPSRLWRLPDRRSVPEERVWQSRDSRPQVLCRWQIHLRPQSSFKNQVRGRLCWFEFWWVVEELKRVVCSGAGVNTSDPCSSPTGMRTWRRWLKSTSSPSRCTGLSWSSFTRTTWNCLPRMLLVRTTRTRLPFTDGCSRCRV